MNQTDKLFIGIDLGTTFCTASIYYDNNFNIIELHGNNSMPSWISFSEFPDRMIFGETAKNDMKVYYIFYDSKRLIGKTLDDFKKLKNERKNWPFTVKAFDNKLKMGIDDPESNSDDSEEEIENNEFKSDGKIFFYPEEVSAFLLKDMISIIKKRYPNVPIENVVVTVPADFNQQQKLATERACKIAGIKKFSLMNEPSASILFYKHIHPEHQFNNCLVVDFGGGTLDVSCATNSNGNVKIVSTGGNSNLGGNDFDRVISKIFKTKLKEDYHCDCDELFEEKSIETSKIINQKRTIKKNLRIESEKTKIELSSKEFFEIETHKIFTPQQITRYAIPEKVLINQEDFIEESQEIITKLKRDIERIINKANFDKHNIDLVLLVGGSCKIPFVRNEIEKIVKGSTICYDINFEPLFSVAKGAAKQASFEYFLVEEEIIVETIPYSLGIQVSPNHSNKFIQAGHSLPFKKEYTFYPTKDYVDHADINFYRGESKYVDDNELIQTMRISNIPKELKRTDYKITLEIKISNVGIIEAKAWKFGEKNNPLAEFSLTMDISHPDDVLNAMIDHFDFYSI